MTERDHLAAYEDVRKRLSDRVRGLDDAALTSKVPGLGDRVKEAGLPALLLDSYGDSVTAGVGEPGATVRGSAFELLRGLTGRRSADQLRALDWHGNVEQYVPIFATYPMRDTPLDE